MTVSFKAPGAQFEKATGLPEAGGLLYFYDVGTTTPKNVYSDEGLTTVISQPAVADSAGRFAQIYLQAAKYRVQLKTSAGVLVSDWDNYDPGSGLAGTALAVANGGTGATTASGARTNLGLGTAAVKDVSTSAQFLANSADNLPGNNAIWTAATPVTVTYAASVALDFNTFVNAKMTLTGNLTLSAPTNMKAGQSGCITLTQDGTGSRTATFNAAFLFAGGIDVTLSTTAGAVDVLSYYCPNTTQVVITAVQAIA